MGFRESFPYCSVANVASDKLPGEATDGTNGLVVMALLLLHETDEEILGDMEADDVNCKT